MKCNECGQKIEEYEFFCKNCKKKLKNISSKNDVKELQELIENQKKLTDLENTKELVNLDKLVEEKLEIQKIEEEKIIDKIQDLEINKEEIVAAEKSSIKDNNKKKKLIIIISIISSILIIGIILLLVFLGKDKDKEKEEIIDYEKIINTYGDLVTNIVKEYMDSTGEIPNWQYITENLNYKKYRVTCFTKNIYSDGSIYLSECNIDNKKTKYIYGEKQVEVKKGKEINIYKEEYDGIISYSNKGSTLVGSITCKTENCEYISSYDKYVLIKEANEYYLYDYTNNSTNFGPFLNDNFDVLVENNTLYGIIYRENNKNNIYSVKVGKVFKDIKGSLLNGEMRFDPTIMYRYNYVILVNNGKNDFVNLKTGNISYTIKENIGGFIEDTNKNIVYIIGYINDPSKFKIYNNNGKSLFDGIEYSKFIVGSNNLLVSTDTKFKVYDKDLKLKINSNDYDEILGLYEDFVVVSKDSDLMILSIEDEVLAVFEDSWNEDSIFYNNLSGKDDVRIYLTVENKKIPSKTEGRYIEYYYTLSTKESGFTQKSSI